MAIPCFVKAYGKYRDPQLPFRGTICGIPGALVLRSQFVISKPTLRGQQSGDNIQAAVGFWHKSLNGWKEFCFLPDK